MVTLSMMNAFINLGCVVLVFLVSFCLHTVILSLLRLPSNCLREAHSLTGI